MYKDTETKETANIAHKTVMKTEEEGANTQKDAKEGR